MFVPSTHQTKYKAIAFAVNWYSDEFYSEFYSYDLIDFGEQQINIHFMQPIEKYYLLLGSRATPEDKNALIVNPLGQIINSFCLGDGIERCIVDGQNHIITSYFDEGVFGNRGWNQPVGKSGIIKWDSAGEVLLLYRF